MASREPVPEYVIHALARVRDTARVNMYGRMDVLDVMVSLHEDEACLWLFDHKDRYMEALEAMGDARAE